MQLPGANVSASKTVGGIVVAASSAENKIQLNHYGKNENVQ